MNLDDAIAAASVTRIRSSARLRSGACCGRVIARTIVGRPNRIRRGPTAAAPRKRARSATVPGRPYSVREPVRRPPVRTARGHGPRRRGEERRAQADGGLPARRGHAPALATFRGSPTSTRWPSCSTALGCRVHWAGDHELSIGVPAGRAARRGGARGARRADARLDRRARAAARARAAPRRCSLPGGDDFGARPVNFHLEGLGAMGADVRVHARRRSRRRSPPPGGSRRADHARVPEPHRDGQPADGRGDRRGHDGDRQRRARARGRGPRRDAERDGRAGRAGSGPSRLVVEGVDALRPADHEVVADRVVAATYLAAATITGGEVTRRRRAPRAHGDAPAQARRRSAASSTGEVGITAKGPARPGACDVATLPYPGVATDYKPLLVAVLVDRRRHLGRHREPLRRPVPLRRGARAAGREGHRPRATTSSSAASSASRRLGARDRRPRRRRARARRTRRRRRDRRDRTPSTSTAATRTSPATLRSPRRRRGARVTGARAPTELLARRAHGRPRRPRAPAQRRRERRGERPRGRRADLDARPQAFSLGITGAPGAGKSTLTDRADHRVARALRARRRRRAGRPGSACCASTPRRRSAAARSSATASGCRTTPSTERVFIRSLATRGHLGGLSVAVPDAARGARRGRVRPRAASRPSASARSSSRSPRPPT